MLKGAEKLTFAANNRLPRKVFPLPYLCYDTNIYHFILRFCKTKKMHIVWHVVQGDVKNLRYSLCNLRTPAIFSQGAIVSD